MSEKPETCKRCNEPLHSGTRLATPDQRRLARAAGLCVWCAKHDAELHERAVAREVVRRWRKMAED